MQADEMQVSSVVSSIRAQRIVHRRLEQLVGGTVLSQAGISLLTRRLALRRFAEGELIVNQGVCGDFLGLVGSGQIAIHPPGEEASRRSPSGDGPTVLLLPGSTFGEAMLIDGRPSGSTVRAVTDAELYVLRRADYLDIAGQRLARPAYGISARLLGLALVAAVLVFLLGAVWTLWGADLGRRPVPGSSPALTPSPLVEVSDAVLVVAPQAGEIIQHAPSLVVQAMLTEPGFAQAALQVDGLRREALANPDPEAAPWIVSWEWADAGEGPHSLLVLAQSPGGEWLTSVPVTVTVVPEGILAFASNRDGAQAVYTMQTDGREVTRWTSGPGDARQPAWRPDGALAYVAEPGIGRALIRQIAVPGGGGTDLFSGHDPAWSPTGARLAFAAAVDEVSQVFAALPPGGIPFQITEEEAYAGQPAWSPDGKRLAYVAQRDGNWDIWVVAADGADPQKLTEDAAMDWAPAWSPDGTQLAFVSNRGGNHQIYTMKDDGRGVQLLTDFELGAEAPAWSPDGFWLAFVAYTGEGEGVNAREIHLTRVDGRDHIRLTYNAFDDALPDWGREP